MKYYTFTAGKKVPSWIWKVKPNDRNGMFKSKSGRVIFGTSCIAIRNEGKPTYIMPANNKHIKGKGVINLSGFFNCAMGAIEGASGVLISAEGMTIADLKLHA